MSTLVQWMKKVFQSISSPATDTTSEPTSIDYETRFINLVKESLLKDSVIYEGHKAIKGLVNDTASYKWHAGIGSNALINYKYDDVTVEGPRDIQLERLYDQKVQEELDEIKAAKLEKIKKILDSEAEAG